MSTGVFQDGRLRAASDAFHDTHFPDLFDQDWRPTFVLEVTRQTKGLVLKPVFCNAILDSSLSLKDALFSEDIDSSTLQSDSKTGCTYESFKAWADNRKWTLGRSTGPLKIVFKDLLWSSAYIKDRWKIIRGEAFEEALRVSRYSDTPFILGPGAASMPLSFASKGLSIDGLARTWNGCWNVNEDAAPSVMIHNVTSHVRFFQEFQWKTTALGDYDLWPSKLQSIVGILMADPSPCVLFWGSENVMIYNEAYVPLLGHKHPVIMGKPGRSALPEVWDQVTALLADGIRHNQPVVVRDMLFRLERSHHLEETYFRSTFMPLRDESGSIVAFYESVIETTDQIVSCRRQHTIEMIEAHATAAKSPEQFWLHVADAMQQQSHDILVASAISIVRSATLEKICAHDMQSDSAIDTFTAEHSVEVWQTLDSGPKYSALHIIDPSIVAAIQKAALSRMPVVLPPQAISHYTCLFSNEPVIHSAILDDTAIALICPVTTETEMRASDFVVLVVNPLRPYDQTSRDFMQHMASILMTAFKTLFLDQKRSEQEQALAQELKIQEYKLAEEVRLNAIAAEKEERKFARLAEGAPVGICVGRPNGTFIFRNDMWYQITGQKKGGDENFSWSDLVHESHQPALENLWDSIMQWSKSDEPKPTTMEVRLKRICDRLDHPDRPGEEAEEVQHAWLLVSVQPNEFDSHGNIETIISVLTDISHQKWAEGYQSRRVKNALKAKQQQQDFVDIVSHEIRNPLGAILISAEEIQESSRDMLVAGTISDADAKTHLDATGIIIRCVQHQKRIVDDILSLSRMDADLLNVTLVRVQPVQIVQEALKLLSPQAQSADVTMELNIDVSIDRLPSQWALLDPSRLTQVLVNLITNAIKFTRGCPRRSIRIDIKASTERPSSLPYMSAKTRPLLDIELQHEAYFEFIVHDTGRGLTKQEQKALFQRFSQASVRTYAEYGGSGLGLFISRVLVEKQGGEIGVASESGVGSQFGFYILAQLPVESRPSTPIPIDGVIDQTAKTTGPVLVRDLQVLLVEDNLINQKVLSKQLRQRGCVVHVANNGLEALSFLERSVHWHNAGQVGEHLSIILMDQEMPVMDGITCVRRIRQMEREGLLIDKIPVIGVTANARPEQIQHLKGAGMDDIVLKPFRVPDLMDQMSKVISAHKASVPVSSD